MLRRVRLLGIVAIALLAGCAGPGVPAAGSEDRSMSTLSLSSPDFVADGSIPVRFTCDGVDVSPALAWSGAPSGTAAYALIVDDPDAGGFVHWIALDLPADRLALDEGASGAGRLAEGTNDFGRIGWGGPCPPSGTHRYVFEVFALDRALGLAGQPRSAAVRTALDGHVLASGRLVGTYRRR